MKITPEIAARIAKLFGIWDIKAEPGQYRTVYRDPKSNFVCNIHNGKRGLTLELQNPTSNPSYAQAIEEAATDS
ncbi:hypothetical protein [Dickeya zeae]|uniref:hypothetical protein n=1 Tax=Dickeya zeae TaxID=204042 RepID=UPI0012682159|nr:hypothetical protein [Dickeya zeae]